VNAKAKICINWFQILALIGFAIAELHGDNIPQGGQAEKQIRKRVGSAENRPVKVPKKY